MMAQKTKKKKVNPLSIIPDSIPIPTLEEEIVQNRKWLKQVIQEQYLDLFDAELFGDPSMNFFLSRAFDRHEDTDRKATSENILEEIEKWADYPEDIRDFIAQSCANVLVCYDDDDEEGVDKNELISNRLAGTLKMHLSNLRQKIYKDLRNMAIAHFKSL